MVHSGKIDNEKIDIISSSVLDPSLKALGHYDVKISDFKSQMKNEYLGKLEIEITRINIKINNYHQNITNACAVIAQKTILGFE